MGHKKRKILYVSPTWNFYGAEKCLYELIEHLDTDRYTPLLLTNPQSSYKGEFKSVGVEVLELDLAVPFKLKYIRKIIKANYALISLVLKHAVDLVHINFNTFCEQSLFVFFAFLKLKRIPWVFHLRYYYVFSALQRFLLLKGRVICVSRAVQKHFLQKRRSDFFTRPLEKKCPVIYDGKALSKFIDDDGAGEVKVEFNLKGKKVVGIVAAIDKLKRIELFLRVAKDVCGYRPDVQFLIIGDVYCHHQDKQIYKESVFNLANELNLKNNVIFTGYRNDVHNLLKAMDVFVLTSSSESLGGVIIEAMASAKPVVASAVGGVVELVEDGVTGYLIDSDRPHDYAEKVALLLNNDAQCRAMGKRAREKALQCYDIKKHVLAVEKLYDDLLCLK